MRVPTAFLITAALVLTACSGGDSQTPADSSPVPVDSPTPGTSPENGGQPPAEERPDGTPTVPPARATVHLPPEFDPQEALSAIEHLAGQIGPREATSPAFHEAASWVEGRFTDIGYEVHQVEVPVPAGDPSYRPEWGTVVEPGESANIIADPPGFDPGEPHVVIGAHLDTVAVAPGAEDNASGVAVVLELARLAAEEPPDPPVRFVAFGAEEPRGPGDDMHHFGSQQYVRELEDAGAGVVAMVSLDRVGVSASRVPVCTGGTGTTEVMDELIAMAEAIDVPAGACENRASDHWSFEKADIPAARLGSVPYAEYHSADDLPEVVDPDQLDRVGRIVWAWLQEVSVR